MTMRDQCIEVMARALAKRRYGINLPVPLGAYSPGSRISECVCAATAAFDTLLEKLKSHEMVIRDNGGVIHELRGAPNDIWQAMLSTLSQQEGK